MFCNVCRKEFNPWILTSWWESQHEFCPSCFDARYYPNINREKKPQRYCVNCGIELPIHIVKTSNRPAYLSSHRQKLCPSCKVEIAILSENKDAIANIARQYPNLVNVIYECRHDHHKKQMHHFDYSRPFDVILLCPHCHRTEHARLKRLNSLTAQAEAV